MFREIENIRKEKVRGERLKTKEKNKQEVEGSRELRELNNLMKEGKKGGGVITKDA